MGVGFAKRANAIRWTVVERMVWAWILTIPIAGALAYLLVMGVKLIGWAG
jgi:PiT family inorganic phosphate transporter